MRRSYITSIFRIKEPTETIETGYIYALDWDLGGEIISKVEVDVPKKYQAPNGRSNGCRGLAVHNGELAVASSDNKIHYYDLDTLEQLSIEDFAGDLKYLHQIKSHDGQLHVCNTGLDRVSVVNRAKVIEEKRLDVFEDLLQPYRTKGSFTQPFNDDALHFNSITWDPNTGDEYHLYMGAFMIFNYTKGEVVLWDQDLLSSPHDLEFIAPDLLAFSNSMDRTVLTYNINNKEIRVLNKIQHPVKMDVAEHAMQGFTRGIAAHKTDLFLCHSPATVERFHFEGTHKYWPEDKVILSEDPNENIYDIILDPRDWKNDD